MAPKKSFGRKTGFPGNLFFGDWEKISFDHFRLTTARQNDDDDNNDDSNDDSSRRPLSEVADWSWTKLGTPRPRPNLRVSQELLLKFKILSNKIDLGFLGSCGL